MRKGILPLLGLAVFVIMALTPATSFAATSTGTAKSHSPHLFSSRQRQVTSNSSITSNSITTQHIAAAGVNASASTAASNNILTYQGGPVMAGTTNVYVILWEPTNNVSANYNSLISRYFSDVGGSPLYKNLAQYPQTGGAFPSNAVLADTWIDTGAYPESPLQDSDVQTEVTHAQSVKSWTSSNNNIFFVFTEKNEGACMSSGVCTPDLSSPGFCAYHNYFGSSNTIYALVPYAASPSFNGGCTPGVPGAAPVSSSPNSDDADLTINVTSHEQMEAATDPFPDSSLSAWQIAQGTYKGEEVGDLCAWLFGPNNAQGGDVVWNSDNYIIQEEWDDTINSCTLSGDHRARYYEIQNFHSSLAMDVYDGGTNAGANVIQWPYKAAANQEWDLVPDNYSSFYQIVNRNSGLVLDVSGGGTNAGAKVIQWTNHHGLNQEWALVPDGANDQIVNLNSGLVIDVYNGGLNQGANAIQWPSHNGTNEEWSFKPVPAYYQIVNRNSNLVMDVYYGGTNAGARVIQWPYHGGLNQTWALVPDGAVNGTPIYQIQNLHSGLVLDVYGGGKTQGVNVIQWGNHNGTNQQWEIVPDGSYYQIVNVNSGLVMDVYDGGKTQGVNVIQWSNHNGTNQQWSLIPTSA